MCGISGWALRPGRTRDDGDLHRLAEALSHRGPDDRGFFVDAPNGIGFAHNRLSIIDLSAGGHQPMLGDRGDVLSFNGEIYNFRQLRAELESLGHPFRSQSDTEVVLRAWEEWGNRCVERLAGMFAFVIWSPARHLLFAARDPLGIKPFYYATMPGDSGFLFASEVKAFLSLPDFAPRLDRKALLQYLELGFTADAERTSLEGVRKLPPGHTLEVVGGVPRAPVRYFHAPRPDPADRRTLDERADELHGVLEQVVREHLIADVPAGLLLSGGLDSAVVAALAAKNGPLQTVTMGFAESLIDERAFGRTVAQHIGSEHREIVVSAADIMDEIDEVAWSIDDLFGDWGLFTTRLLYRKCHELGLKVVLVGEGADELFGGYGSFYEVDRKGPAAWRSFQLHRWFSGRRWGKGYFELARLMRGYLREADGDWFHAIRLYEVRNQLPNNYMMKVDKASMSVSTEARTPYLDRRVADLAMRTPREFLLANGASKLVLRRMAERHHLLPHDIVWRRKFGAGIATDWIETIPQFRAFVRERVLRPGSWTDELGLRDAMTGYFDRGETGYPPPRSISLFHNLAWRLVLLELWTSKYLPGQAAA